MRAETIASAAAPSSRPGRPCRPVSSSRAVVVRGKDFVTVAANSRIRIPTAEQKRGMFEVLQEWGNAVFQIDKQPNPHFGVQTPVSRGRSEGHDLSRSPSRSRARRCRCSKAQCRPRRSTAARASLIRPGILASVGAGDRFRLTVQGQDTRTIDSPQRSSSQAPAPSSQSSNGDVPAPAAQTESASFEATPNSGGTGEQRTRDANDHRDDFGEARGPGQGHTRARRRQQRRPDRQRRRRTGPRHDRFRQWQCQQRERGTATLAATAMATVLAMVVPIAEAVTATLAATATAIANGADNGNGSSNAGGDGNGNANGSG